MKLTTILTTALTLASTSTLAGEIINEPYAAGEGYLASFFRMQISGFEESADILSIAVSATYLNENNEAIGLLNEVLWGGSPTTFTNWDGLIISKSEYGQIGIFDKSAITWGNQSFNASDIENSPEFISFLKENELNAVQLPLLIKNGELDVNDNPEASKAIRRIAFSYNYGPIGIYQSTEPMTLYEATQDLLSLPNLEPINMAVNLPMGEHDFCVRWNVYDIETCGRNNFPDDSRPMMFLVLRNYTP